MSSASVIAAGRTIDTSDVRALIIEKVLIERQRQIHKWGWQRHPDGTASTPENNMRANVAKMVCDQLAGTGKTTWADILNEEIAEAYDEDGGTPEHITELVQATAVLVAWLEDALTR